MIRIALVFVAFATIFPMPCSAFAENGQAPARGVESFQAFLPSLEEWEAVDGPTEYAPENLYDLINGEAEAFVGYGFVKGLAAILESKNGVGALEWRLYDMGTKLNAFGIYQLYAPSDAKELKVGTAGLFKDQYAAFYIGRHFVQVEGLTGEEGEEEAAITLATETARLLPQDTKPPDELYLFPKKNLVKRSIRYTPQGALGYQFLKAAMEARYLLKGTKDPIKTFVLQYKKRPETQMAFDAYRAFLKDKGKAEIEEVFMGEQALRGVDPYHGNLVLIQAGRWMVGVTGAADWSALETLARDILKAAVGKRAKPKARQPK